MKLYTPDWTVAVFDGHWQVVTPRRHDEFSGYLNSDKRMITPDLHRVFELSEDAFALVLYKCGFSVHDLAGPSDLAAKVMDNTLMSQTDAEDRQMFRSPVQ